MCKDRYILNGIKFEVKQKLAMQELNSPPQMFLETTLKR